jgi:hypothetical protein
MIRWAAQILARHGVDPQDYDLWAEIGGDVEWAYNREKVLKFARLASGIIDIPSIKELEAMQQEYERGLNEPEPYSGDFNAVTVNQDPGIILEVTPEEVRRILLNVQFAQMRRG